MNLLLISVDSLRLDFAPGVSAAVRTPRFSDLTCDFHLCQRCFSVSSATRPVHTSLFTGLYPFEHGIEGQQSPAMRQGFADLFTLCRRAGYAIGAFSEAPDIFTGLSYADHIAPLAGRRAAYRLAATPRADLPLRPLLERSRPLRRGRWLGLWGDRAAFWPPGGSTSCRRAIAPPLSGSSSSASLRSWPLWTARLGPFLFSAITARAGSPTSHITATLCATMCSASPCTTACPARTIPPPGAA